MTDIHELINKCDTALFLGVANGHNIVFSTNDIDVRNFYKVLQEAFKHRKLYCEIVCALAYAFANDEILRRDVTYLSQNIYDNDNEERLSSPTTESGAED